MTQKKPISLKNETKQETPENGSQSLIHRCILRGQKLQRTDLSDKQSPSWSKSGASWQQLLKPTAQNKQYAGAAHHANPRKLPARAIQERK